VSSFKNEYGIQVKMPAKPTFPVEYLFVNVSAAAPRVAHRLREAES
jgi:nuclear protein localization family protein 4